MPEGRASQMHQQLLLHPYPLTSLRENSLIYCRQYPQGAASFSPERSVTTYTSLMCLQPSSTILAMAVRSAQSELTAFYTLHPV